MYVTESLRLQGEGKYLGERYVDLIHPTEDYDAEEIIEGVIARAGLEVISE